jgi:hypothetical protein
MGPFELMTKSMRRMADLRLDDITRGVENFANPSARGMLESMGRTRDEQVATMVTMLRNSSEEDIAEMGEVFGLAMARLAEERTAGRHRPARRRPTAAERRRERRLLS